MTSLTSVRAAGAPTPARTPCGDRLDFDLAPELEAHEPPEARGATGRSDVRLLVSVGTDTPIHAHFVDVVRYLAPGDVLVVNTTATIPAAIDGTMADGTPVVVHFSTSMSIDPAHWVVEVRRPDDVATAPWLDDLSGQVVTIVGGGIVQLRERARSNRLWDAMVWTPEPTAAHLARYGRPIRYRYVPEAWPLDAYQTVFGRLPGSAEMASASRPFTADLVVALVTAGVILAPVTLHTGVSSLEGDEAPYPEWFTVPADTAWLLNAAHDAGRRVVAVGTTVVRALESATDADGRARARTGWTDLVVTPQRGVRLVDGLLTGWHEPGASHLRMLEAIAGCDALRTAYAAAVETGYRWHEFGDLHLILPGPQAT